MKRIANRVLALIVALTMLLLPASALAAEKNMVVLSAVNFEISIDGETISLPVTLQLGVGADVEGERGLALVSLLAAGQTAATVYGAVEDGQVKAYLNGMEYGIVVPVEDLLALVEEEMGMTLEDAAASVSPEIQAALTDLITAASNLQAAGEADIEALQAAMGVTLTEAGAEEINPFGEAVSAAKSTFVMQPQTMTAVMDNMKAASPAFAAYWESYMNFMTVVMAESGEEVSMDEITEMFDTIAMGMTGTVWTTETVTVADLTVSMTAEGETIELPFSVASSITDDRSITQFDMTMDVDSESLYVTVFADESEGSLTANVNFGVLDNETGEVDTDISLALNTATQADSSTFRLSLSAQEDDELVEFGIQYTGSSALSEESDSYDGELILIVNAEGEAIQIGMDTNVTVSAMPEGELLTLPESSINALEADEDTWNQFATDAQTPLMQAIGVLMQDATIAELISGMMG